MAYRWRNALIVTFVVLMGGMPLALNAQSAEMVGSLEPIILGQRASIRSVVLGVDRPLLIYTPPGYEQSADFYPVLYLLGSGSTLIAGGSFLHASGVTQFLSSSARRMPEMIVVGVPTFPGNGGINLDPARGANDFLRFLRDEVQPWVESQYRTSPFRVLFGHSLGGRFVIHVLMEDPDAFQAYIVSSPSLWWNEGTFVAGAASIFEGRPDLKGALYMTVGNEGFMGIWSLASILETHAPESFRWKWTQMPEEHHGSVSHRSLYDGLEWLFDGWRLPFDREAKLLMQDGEEGWLEINEHYGALSERLGFKVQVRENAVRTAARRLVEEGRFEDAILALERNRELYPASARVFEQLGDLYHLLCRWDESRENYTKAYGVAQDLSYPNVEDYREALAQVTAELESGNACTVTAFPTEVEVPVHILETYVGEYELQPGLFSIILTLDGDALFHQVTGYTRRRAGNGKLALFAESETKFSTKKPSYQISFTITKDDSGAVTGIILHGGSRDRSGRKVR